MSASKGSVPVLLTLTKTPVLVSTPSKSPSLSVSALRGFVFVSTISCLSLNPSSSVSAVSGLVLASNSSMFVRPSSSSSPSGSSTPYFSSQASGKPSPSSSSCVAPIGLAPSANALIVAPGRTSLQMVRSSTYPLYGTSPLLRAPKIRVPPPLGALWACGPPSISPFRYIVAVSVAPS